MKKKIAIVMLAILAVSAFALLANAGAQTAPNAIAPVVSTVSIQQLFVRMDGIITGWGSDKAYGSIQAQSRTMMLDPSSTKQGLSCSAIWTTNNVRPLATVRSLQNFTYVFYAARLVDGNYSALDFNGNCFFMNGTWNVWNVTTTFTIITDTNGNFVSVHCDREIVSLAAKAYGELEVRSGWTSFTLAINGVDPLTGTVFAELTTSRMFNPFITQMGSGSPTTVTSADLKNIARAYGSMPGWGNYDQRLDFCQHYKIDITDLSTAAANVNQ